MIRIKQRDGTFKSEDLEVVLSRLSTRLEGTKLDSLSSAIVSPDDDIEFDQEYDEATIADIASQLEDIQLRASETPLSSKGSKENLHELATIKREGSSYMSTLTGRRRYWAQKMLRAGISMGKIRVMHEATDFYSLSKAERLMKVAEKYRVQSVGRNQLTEAGEERSDEEMDLAD